jgi:hypothetical protein
MALALGTLGLLVVSAIPATIGVGQAVSAQKKQNAAQKETAQFNLTVAFRPDGGAGEQDEEEAFCVLQGGKVREADSKPPCK